MDFNRLPTVCTAGLLTMTHLLTVLNGFSTFISGVVVSPGILSCFICQGDFISINDFVSPISYPLGSVVIVMCHDDHRRSKVFMSCP